jgi:hypothetical protein
MCVCTIHDGSISMRIEWDDKVYFGEARQLAFKCCIYDGTLCE